MVGKVVGHYKRELSRDSKINTVARASDHVSSLFFFLEMKLMLRPEWRLWPLSSFLGLLDLKTGVTVALLFAVSCQTLFIQPTTYLLTNQLLNKVAGVYGLIAVLTGAGGSFAQLSMYIYSVIALVGLGWGLRAVKKV